MGGRDFRRAIYESTVFSGVAEQIYASLAGFREQRQISDIPIPIPIPDLFTLLTHPWCPSSCITQRIRSIFLHL